jgi:hypothetical protein
MASRLTATLLVASGVLCLARPAAARDSAAGEALYRAAKESAKKGDWEKACAQFAESQRLDPAPGTLVNLADCEEHRGLVTSAWSHFTEVQPQFKPGDARAAYARDHAAALEKRIPHLTIKLQPGAPASARVFRDEEELKGASLGVPLPVDPGKHVVVVKVGSAESRFPVTAVESQTAEVVVTAPAEAAAPKPVPEPIAAPPKPIDAPPPPIDKPVESGNRTLGFVLVSAGGVGLAVGGVTGVLALSNASKVKDTCGPSYATCDQASVDNAATGKTMATVSTVAFIAGGALLAGGLYFVFTAPKSSSASAHAGLAIGPSGAALQGTF